MERVKVGSTWFYDVSDANVAAALKLLGHEPVSYDAETSTWRFYEAAQRQAQAFVALRENPTRSASHILA